jgi:hypothetical protein
MLPTYSQASTSAQATTSAQARAQASTSVSRACPSGHGSASTSTSALSSPEGSTSNRPAPYAGGGESAWGGGGVPDPFHLDTLKSLFSQSFNVRQIGAIYHFSGCNLEESVECLANGGSVEAITQMVKHEYLKKEIKKVHVDSDELWPDMLSFYKCVPSVNMQLRICLDGQPPVDTGGVRRQIFTSVFSEFVSNTRIRLFDGPANHLRPFYSAESRGCGIFKALGVMVGHSICQDGAGFPFLSPLCYWYIAKGEEAALQYSCLDDIGQDSAAVISKVATASSKDIRILFCCYFFMFSYYVLNQTPK